ncbi:Zinc finger CCCH domain-containing protein 2 [Linum grandiflorum]
MTTAIFSDHHHKNMTTAAAIYSDHHHHNPSSPSAKLPPRKLLLNRNNNGDFPLDDMSSLAHFYKHLPCNKAGHLDGGEDEEEDGDPYSSDQFRMYDFKVRRCTRSRSHDWTDCPFAHPGEKARRRDPRKFHYTGAVCPEFRRGGGCSRGDNCEFAHGVFECWLHPSRYRTEACKDGKGCKRKICFFAHSPRQLRLLPPEKSSPSTNRSGGSKVVNHRHQSCGCLLCRGCGGGGDSSSPTSTLIGLSHLSPPLSPSFSSSPPLSPVGHNRPPPSAASGFSHRLSKFQTRYASYKDVLSELMSSLEAMNFSEEAAAAAVAAAAAAASSVSSPNSSGLSVNPWINANEANFNIGANYGDDRNYYQVDQQQQFVMSPSTPPASSGFDKYDGVFEQNDVGSGDNAAAAAAGYDPDLGWVNELLM